MARRRVEDLHRQMEEMAGPMRYSVGPGDVARFAMSATTASLVGTGRLVVVTGGEAYRVTGRMVGPAAVAGGLAVGVLGMSPAAATAAERPVTPVVEVERVLPDSGSQRANEAINRVFGNQSATKIIDVTDQIPNVLRSPDRVHPDNTPYRRTILNQLQPPTAATGNKLLVVGDSLMTATNKKGNLFAQEAAELGWRPVDNGPLDNMVTAKGGRPTSEVIQILQTDPRVPQADVIVVESGTNDLNLRPADPGAQEADFRRLVSMYGGVDQVLTARNPRARRAVVNTVTMREAPAEVFILDGEKPASPQSSSTTSTTRPGSTTTESTRPSSSTTSTTRGGSSTTSPPTTRNGETTTTRPGNAPVSRSDPAPQQARTTGAMESSRPSAVAPPPDADRLRARTRQALSTNALAVPTAAPIPNAAPTPRGGEAIRPSQRVNIEAVNSPKAGVDHQTVRDVTRHLMDEYGLSPRGAAMLVGTFLGESSLNPNTQGDFEGGVPQSLGIAQWYKGRREGMLHLRGDLYGQIRYAIVQDMPGQTRPGASRSLVETLQDPNAPYNELRDALAYYERYEGYTKSMQGIEGDFDSHRFEYGRRIYDMLMSQMQAPPPPPPSASPAAMAPAPGPVLVQGPRPGSDRPLQARAGPTTPMDPNRVRTALQGQPGVGPRPEVGSTSRDTPTRPSGPVGGVFTNAVARGRDQLNTVLGPIRSGFQGTPPGQGAQTPNAAPPEAAPRPEGYSMAGRSIDRMPLDRPLQETSAFGWRTLNGKRDFHGGVDFAANQDPVHATVEGTVVGAAYDKDCGNGLSIDAGRDSRGKPVLITVCHLSKFNVQMGQRVGPDDIIGISGSTGASTGPHLHFQVKIDGETVDPRPYLRGAKF